MVPEDGEHVGLCIEFPSLNWLAETPEEALAGVRKVVLPRWLLIWRRMES